jgi:argininosuccinate synthase
MIKPKKIILAYSGGLDTSVMLHWLKREYQCEIVAFTADVGQGEELHNLESKALKTGASKLIVKDLRDEFVREFVFTAVKANAVYEGHYLLGTSISRPIIAKHQIEVAIDENADSVAHGATGKGNDQVRLELGYYSLNPEINVIAPWRSWPFKSRSELISYARKFDIPVVASVDKPFSVDRNLMHLSFEGGVLEDPWLEPPLDTYVLTAPQEKTPSKASLITIEFEGGVPVSINGESMGAKELLNCLNLLGGSHGIGRVDMVENRYVGIKSRGVYETPGVTILHLAHRALESITLDREVMHIRDGLALRFAELIYNGYWYSPEFDLLKKTIDLTQLHVTGTVRLKLYRGLASVMGRKSPIALYSKDLATFERDSLYDQANASGFIKINALRLQQAATLRAWS